MRGRIYLTPTGQRQYLLQAHTLEDIEREHVRLENDLVLKFRCEDGDEAGNPDDLFFEGTVHHDPDREGWYVLIDETSFFHESDD